MITNPSLNMSDPAEPDYLEDLRSAVALSYQEGSAAPAVVARGRGLVADEIIRRAHEAGVFVHESRELVSLLMQVDLDQHIPPTLYAAVAELLAWIYQIEQRPLPQTPTQSSAVPEVLSTSFPASQQKASPLNSSLNAPLNTPVNNAISKTIDQG